MSRGDGGKALVLGGALLLGAVATVIVIGATTLSNSINTVEHSDKIAEELETRRRKEKMAISAFHSNHDLDRHGSRWLDYSRDSSEGDDVDVNLYRKLLSCARNESEAVIARDINRTMPTHAMFKSEEGKKKLSNILIAYSRWDPHVGYVQGMNFIVANLLLHTDEENAFILLVRMMQQPRYNVRDYFEPKLRRYLAFSYIMDALVQKYHPKLFSHFQSLGIESKHFIQEWVTLYTYSSNMPKKTLNCIWDIFFLSGWSIIFRVWLTLLASSEEHLFKLNLEQCVGYLHTLHKDIDRLSEGEKILTIPHDLVEKAVTQSRVTEKEIEDLEKMFNLSL